ncbi:tat pathway signal sequence [Nocardia sp. NPDC051570]|uniref:tat pathway signal sequence n=1 Tax=Nocardia sp. NPDC051570 TaxID=3364324 RepID=UPI00379AB9E1
MSLRGRLPRSLHLLGVVIALALVAGSGCATGGRTGCPAHGSSCGLRARITEADAYLSTRPGVVGYLVRDRVTGFEYRNANAGTEIWTASTIKLAMVADLLTRDRAHVISLSPGDHADIDAMLHVSDDDAADRLWFTYSGPDHMTFDNAFQAFGMTGLIPERGYTDFFPYWGFQKCTAEDLDRLMHHVLDGLDPADRTYIVDRMRSVDPIQQWGVWGAGPAARPGNKDGWSDEDTGAIANSVGFAGPAERYTLAIMDSLNGKGDIANGQETDTHVARILLAGLASDDS